jgi:hypothetical protein
VRPHVSGHERFEQRAVIVVESPLLDEDLSHGATFRESPGLKGGDQGGLLDHSVLEGEQAEKEATRSVGAIGHGGLSRPGSNGAKGKREPSSGLSTERGDQRAIIHGNRRLRRIEVGNWFWATSPLAFFPSEVSPADTPLTVPQPRQARRRDRPAIEPAIWPRLLRPFWLLMEPKARQES